MDLIKEGEYVWGEAAREETFQSRNLLQQAGCWRIGKSTLFLVASSFQAHSTSNIMKL